MLGLTTSDASPGDASAWRRWWGAARPCRAADRTRFSPRRPCPPEWPEILSRRNAGAASPLRGSHRHTSPARGRAPPRQPQGCEDAALDREVRGSPPGRPGHDHAVGSASGRQGILGGSHPISGRHDGQDRDGHRPSCAESMATTPSFGRRLTPDRPQRGTNGQVRRPRRYSCFRRKAGPCAEP